MSKVDFDAIAYDLFSRLDHDYTLAEYCIDTIDLPCVVNRLNNIHDIVEMAVVFNYLVNSNDEDQLIELTERLYFAITDYDIYAGISSLIDCYIAVKYYGMPLSQELENESSKLERSTDVQWSPGGTGLLFYGGCRSSVAESVHQRNRKDRTRSPHSRSKRSAKADRDRAAGRSSWFESPDR